MRLRCIIIDDNKNDNALVENQALADTEAMAETDAQQLWMKLQSKCR